MNPAATSKEEILRASRTLIEQQGWKAISIRSVAATCGVSVGAIYNYFPSKASLVEATVESIWCEIFHGAGDKSVCQDTQACVSWLYGRMEQGHERYPGFFRLHSLGFEHDRVADGKKQMQVVWQHILEKLRCAIANDPRVRRNAFNERLTRARFADLLFSLMLAALLQEDFDPDPVLEIIRRTIY